MRAVIDDEVHGMADGGDHSFNGAGIGLIHLQGLESIACQAHVTVEAIQMGAYGNRTWVRGPDQHQGCRGFHLCQEQSESEPSRW
jgi:hypothetical protein